MGRLFGTDGVRGIANLELTPELAFKLGRSCAHIIYSQKKSRPRFLIGTDTRVSKDMLAFSLAAGICSSGGDAIFAGVIPTPGIAYLSRTLDVDAGAVISASHNSYEYNGVKFFSNQGIKLSDEAENMIEALIMAERDEIPSRTGAEIGVASNAYELTSGYEEFLITRDFQDLSGLKILLDCANGAASGIAPKVLRKLGATVDEIYCKPDGFNINLECGSTHIDKLAVKAASMEFDCAAVLDGDADRLLMLDENGKIVDGDQLLAILAIYFKNKGKLKNSTFVSTVMSNMGLEKMALRNGISLIKTKVGDRYVLEEMIKGGHSLGGEQSGHIILLDINTTGDGILTALSILSIMKETKCKLSELANEVEIFPQILINARVENSRKEFFENDEIITALCKMIEAELGSDGRLLVRPSGTEPLIRVMIEGRDPGYIGLKAKELASLIESRMNRTIF